MKKLRTWSYIAIAAQILSTGLAWVVNGDVISSIFTAVLIPLSFAALGLAAIPTIPLATARSVLRIESTLLFVVSASALVLAATMDNTSANPPAAVEMISVASVISAVLVLTLVFGLWRAGAVSFAVAAIGAIAALGLVASNIDSINLMVIAAARASMILFLVLLAQSLDPAYATS